jgi:hypothetical protein
VGAKYFLARLMVLSRLLQELARRTLGFSMDFLAWPKLCWFGVNTDKHKFFFSTSDMRNSCHSITQLYKMINNIWL